MIRRLTSYYRNKYYLTLLVNYIRYVYLLIFIVLFR
jgi:hypothetical protein